MAIARKHESLPIFIKCQWIHRVWYLCQWLCSSSGSPNSDRQPVALPETASNREFVWKKYGDACNQMHIAHRHPTAIHFRSVCLFYISKSSKPYCGDDVSVRKTARVELMYSASRYTACWLNVYVCVCVCMCECVCVSLCCSQRTFLNLVRDRKTLIQTMLYTGD
jgi:hypothetical protein